MSAGVSVMPGRHTPDPVLVAFAAEVGAVGPVCVVGGRTQWDVGGAPEPGVRGIAAPAGVVGHQPAEMIVRVRAGTTVAELTAVLAEAGQMVPLDPDTPERATVGGVLAVGHSGRRRLRFGAIRDTVLEAHFVTADGTLVKAGGPVVKNVTGFDLCRLLVGSLGTLGLLAEVVLRCQPVPTASQWFMAAEAADPFSLYTALFRPSAILWNGRSVWVLLEGHPADVAHQAAEVLGSAFVEVAGPPAVGAGTRVSARPGELRRLAGMEVGGAWLAEVGVGTVHTESPLLVGKMVRGRTRAPADGPADGPAELRAIELQVALKAKWDPTGRLNPGRQPW